MGREEAIRIRLIVPYVSGGLRDGVYNAASQSGYAVELHDVSGSDSNYWRLLDTLWRKCETFVLIEQDILVKRETVAGFDECRNVYCSAHYPYVGGMSTGLGCTRFRQELLREHPDVLTLVGEMDDPAHSARHYCTLDAHIRTVLGGLGVTHCGAHGQVEHLSDHLPAHAPCRRHFERTESV